VRGIEHREIKLAADSGQQAVISAHIKKSLIVFVSLKRAV